MSVLALSQPAYSISLEPLGGSTDSESRSDTEAHADDPISGRRLFSFAEFRLTTSYEAVNPPAGQLPTSQAVMVSDHIHAGTSSGAVLGGTGHTITIDNRTILPPVRPPSGMSRFYQVVLVLLYSNLADLSRFPRHCDLLHFKSWGALL